MRIFSFSYLSILLALSFVACGDSNANGPAEVVLSKKAFSKVLIAYSELDDNFYDGVCIVQNDGKYGAINTKGKEIIPCNYERLYKCAEGMIPYRETNANGDDLYGFLNKDGVIVVPAKYSDVALFSEGMARVAVIPEGKYSWDQVYGFIDKKGEEIIKASFDRAGNFSSGLAPVYIESKSAWGYIDADSNFVIAPAYDNAEDFADGVAYITKGDKRCIIDPKGEVVFVLNAKTAFLDETYSNGLIPVATLNGTKIKCGYMNTLGELVIDYIYDYAAGFDLNGTAEVIQGTKLQTIDSKGQILEEKTLDLKIWGIT